MSSPSPPSVHEIEPRGPQTAASALVLKKLSAFTVLIFALAVLLSLVHFKGSPALLMNQVLRHHLGADSVGCMDPAWDAYLLGKPVYETVLFGRIAKFQYPISSLLIYKLAAVFHLRGWIFIKALVILSYPAALLLSGEIFLAALPIAKGFGRRQRLFAGACIFVFGAVFYPLLYGTYLGQIQVFQVLLWGLVLYLWMHDRLELSGICVALICVVKPQFVVFLLWGLLRRRWRFFLPLLGSLIVIQLLSVVFFGWHNQVEFLTVVSHLSRHGEAFYANQSVNGILQRLLVDQDTLHFDALGFPPFHRTVYLATAISSILLLTMALILPVARRWRNSSLDLLFFGLITTIASPIAWEHHYGYFFAAIVYMMALFLHRRRSLPIAFQVVCALFVVPVSLTAGLLNTPLTVLATFELFAGIGLLVSLAFLAETASEDLNAARIPFEGAAIKGGIPAGSPNLTPAM